MTTQIVQLARKRLLRDFQKLVSPLVLWDWLQEDPPMGVSASPSEENILMWNAVIFGPSETPFEDGTFRLTMHFSEKYPNVPPYIRFTSKMFHPNVYNDGSICLDILANNWSPTYDVAAILTSIQSLLHDPNPNSPANNEAAMLFRENRREYTKRVQQIVQDSWEGYLSEDEDDEEDDSSDSDGAVGGNSSSSKATSPAPSSSSASSQPSSQSNNTASAATTAAAPTATPDS